MNLAMSSSFLTDGIRWRAVQQRNHSAHSSFIYAVRSTHIFCRPTCPARLARRANVVFFDDAVQAHSAGFRACKRCRPDSSDASTGSPKVLSMACDTIEKYEGNLLITDLAKMVGVTVRHLHNLFKIGMGCTPAEYTRRMRNTYRARDSAQSSNINESHTKTPASALVQFAADDTDSNDFALELDYWANNCFDLDFEHANLMATLINGCDLGPPICNANLPAKRDLAHPAQLHIPSSWTTAI